MPNRTNQRLLGLDVLKGLAVVSMIIYHLFFDLSYFNYLKIDFSIPFWQNFRYVVITAFLFSVGVIWCRRGSIWLASIDILPANMDRSNLDAQNSSLFR